MKTTLQKDKPLNEIEFAWNKEAMTRYMAFKTGNVKGLSHTNVMRDAYQTVGKRVLARECIKMDQKREQAMADEWLSGDIGEGSKF